MDQLARTSLLLTLVAVVFSACATLPWNQTEREARRLTDCAQIAEVAKAQYEFDGDRTPLPLDRRGYAPQCDWASLGLKVELLEMRTLPYPLSPLVSFDRPQRHGDHTQVVARYWNGLHRITRTCRLREVGGQWRLIEDCPITDSY